MMVERDTFFSGNHGRIYNYRFHHNDVWIVAARVKLQIYNQLAGMHSNIFVQNWFMFYLISTVNALHSTDEHTKYGRGK